jgi:hypothetical protein
MVDRIFRCALAVVLLLALIPLWRFAENGRYSVYGNADQNVFAVLDTRSGTLFVPQKRLSSGAAWRRIDVTTNAAAQAEIPADFFDSPKSTVPAEGR